MRYLVSFFFFPIFLYGFNYHLKPYKISEGVHCFFGLPSQVSNINGGNMINSCYVETSDGYLVIDSGPTYSYAKEAYAVMRMKKKLPVKYVINTSWNEVHVLGNEFYKQQGAKLFGPKGYKEHIEEKKMLFLETKLSAGALVNTRVVPLDIYVKEDQVLKFDKMEILIKTLANNENHLYVYIKDKKILFAGDFVFNNRIVPLNHGRSIARWLKVLDELNELEWVDIISSHGHMTRRSALEHTKNYLTLLQTEVLQRIKSGESREEVLRNVKLLSFKNDRFYNTWHPRNVSRAYDELKSHLPKNKTVNKKAKLKDSNIIDVKPKIMVKKKVIKTISRLKYKSFAEAIKSAKVKHKIVLIKVRSTVCKYCTQLDRLILRNTRVKKLLNKYFEVVKINSDYEDIPMGLRIQSTPTLIFVQANNKKVLMKITGIRALGELLEILDEAVTDGHLAGYLRP